MNRTMGRTALLAAATLAGVSISVSAESAPAWRPVTPLSDRAFNTPGAHVAIKGKVLKPDAYVLSGVATNSSGKSPKKKAHLRVVRP